MDFAEVEIDRIWMQVFEHKDLERVRKFAVEFELIVNPIYPMPNLQKKLFSCRNKKKQMGIISNAQFCTPYLFKWFLDSSPENLGFHPALTFYSFQYGYAKPFMFLFQAAAKKLKELDIPACSVLYVGNDMLSDIFPAKAVGFRTALFAGDARSLRLRKDDPGCKSLSLNNASDSLVMIAILRESLYSFPLQSSVSSQEGGKT